MKTLKFIATAAFALGLILIPGGVVLADTASSEVPLNNNVTGSNTNASGTSGVVGSENPDNIMNSNQLAQAAGAGSSLTWLWWTLLLVVLIAILVYLYKQSAKKQ